MVNMEPLNRKQQIDSVISIAEVTAGRKWVLIENMVDTELCVRADKNTLNTIVRNLISNAVKYSNSGGVVIINSYVRDGQ